MTNTETQATGKGLDPKWLTLIAVMIGNFMAPLDASIVNTILPSFTRFFRTEIAIVQWVPTVYLLTISSLILLYGRLGDMLGHKRIFLTGLAAFTVTSLLCGLSQNIWMLITFRALQGLSGGMIMAVGAAIVTGAFPPYERGKALGIHAVCIAVALSLGPTLGGLITQYLNWRFVFFVNVPIGIFALAWGLNAIPPGLKKSGQRLDWPGAAAAFVFLFCLLLYANRGEDWGWLARLPLGLLALAFLSGALFIRLERTSAQPMLNLALFNSRVFSLCNLSSLLSFMAAYTVIFLTPFYLTFVLKYDILKVGLIMAASPLATLCVAPFSGAASDRIGTRPLACCGMSVCTLSLFFFSGLDASADGLDAAWRLAVFGLGLGIFQSPNNSAVMGSVPKAYLGITAGTLAAMRNVGMVMGIAVASAVLYKAVPAAVSKNPGSFRSTEIKAFLTGFHWAYLSGMVMAGAAVLTSLAAGKRQRQE